MIILLQLMMELGYASLTPTAAYLMYMVMKGRLFFSN